MKSQRRHELQRNELADWLANFVERIKPHSGRLLTAVILGTLVVGGAIWWMRQSAAEAANAWQSVHAAWVNRSPAELEVIVGQYRGHEIAHWAAVLAGNIHLANGCHELFTNKPAAAEQLRKAIEHYRMVQEESDLPALLEQAAYGLGRAYEALAGTRESQGQALDDAIAAYTEVVEKWPDGPYAELATLRLEALSRDDTKAFYDQFAMFERKPPSSAFPNTLGDLPDDLKKAYEDGTFPDLTGPLDLDGSPTDGTKPEADSKLPTEPGEAGPLGPEAKPAREPEKSEADPAETTADPGKPPDDDGTESAKDAAQSPPAPAKPAASEPVAPNPATPDETSPQPPAAAEPAPKIDE